ncbi:MAG TPA: tRNA lysidine(34) synthetase TilS [Geminicoccaceae bacterium]|nr:tRNA lysidine(34) synthetase TilS [Geminicoccus sp.]HMU50377.1 tRNA lysidine(34) synthetase TilS [Geminicoccaceae bacterium]
MPAAAEAALEGQEFAALLDALGPFERRPEIAAAVSGGPDSMALALLARQWAEDRRGRLTALIVDHGLRAESAAEAALTADRLAGSGIASRILRWEGPKPGSGIQAAAREARYRLLGDACRAAGILHLLLGHHADDQAETVALRAARGSGRRGLAGMPAIREVPGLRLLRPLLGIPKSRLLATLRRRGVGWVEDPSNRDPHFARARLRAAPPAPPAADLGPARAEEDRALAALMAERARPHPLGFVRFDLAGLDRLPAPVVERLILTVSGRTVPPRGERLARLLDRLAAGDTTATLGGCVLRRRGGELLVVREPRAAAEVVDLLPGRTCRWDGRFEIRLAAGAAPATLRRLGVDGHAALDEASRLAARAIPAPARLALPSLWRRNQLAWQPFLIGPPGMSEVSRCGFVPPMGLAEAPFVPANVVSNGDPLIYRQG